MSLTVTAALLDETKHDLLKHYRTQSARFTDPDRIVTIDTSSLDADALQDLIAAATTLKDGKTVRAIDSIVLARAGDFNKPVPNFKAFQEVLVNFLKQNMIDGWLYSEGPDGKFYPELVTSIAFDSGTFTRNGKTPPSVKLTTMSYGCNSHEYSAKLKTYATQYHFSPEDVVRRRIVDILELQGLYKETPALKEAYAASMDRFRSTVANAFAKQFRVNGAVYRHEADNHGRRGEVLDNIRVIHDLDSASFGAFNGAVESILFDNDLEAGGVGSIPEHPVVRVYNLGTHEMIWMHSDNMVPYEYDKSLRDKLVLPKSHRDLLDVLTTDLDAFVGDFIEGKSAGNIVLAKGIPGVGKTLTAEVYSELIETPLFSIHTGLLGTEPEEIAKNLRKIFQQAKRWNCVLLLDEADVFVMKRGDDIKRNAIVAEFLRTLEYFDGLLFMTTNRPDDIDDGIISRCAAIIEYLPPTADDCAAIWLVMAQQFGSPLAAKLIKDLVDLFPGITPRDIKMLFRLALRVSKRHQEELTINTFRQCAMFRAIMIKR